MTPMAKKLRKVVLETSCRGQDGNLQSVFSAIDIIWALYDRVLNLTPENYKKPDRNIFVCSKGQANLGLLAVLAEKSFLKASELNSFCNFDSRISMQADRTKLPFIEVSAGSLGHGFPIAVGMAWAAKIKKYPSQIYVLVGDGEINEGSMWEAFMFASSENLDNLTVIIDDNNSIAKMINIGNLANKLEAFGFETTEINGHDEESICRATAKSHKRPQAVIAKTVRGYGSKTIMQDNSWFHRAPTPDELQWLCTEVDRF